MSPDRTNRRASSNHSGCETGAWCAENGTTATYIPFNNSGYAPENRNYNYEWESNGSMNTSASDETWANEFAVGTISNSSDVDYWDINITSSRYVDFWLNLPASTVDYDMSLYDYYGNLKSWNTSLKGTGVDENFRVYLPAGRYYIKVYPWNYPESSLKYKTYQLLIK